MAITMEQSAGTNSLTSIQPPCNVSLNGIAWSFGSFWFGGCGHEFIGFEVFAVLLPGMRQLRASLFIQRISESRRLLAPPGRE
jgi:hypothetical protein